MTRTRQNKSQSRKNRTRLQIRRRTNGRPRLSVHRSGKHIYAQIIDDGEGKTLVAASSVDQIMRKQNSTGASVDTASEVGKLIAERAVALGVIEVVFDRGEFRYHGRVKALAEGAREGGLSF